MFNFNFESTSTDSELIEMYKLLRKDYPVFWSSEHKAWIVSRYSDVIRGLADYRLFTYADTDSLVGRDLLSLTNGTSNIDYSIDLPPEYQRNRKIIMNIYNNGISNNLDNKIFINIQNLFNKIKDQGVVDVIKSVTNYIPVLTICEITGYDYNYKDEILLIASRLWERNNRETRIDIVKNAYKFLIKNKPSNYLYNEFNEEYINKFIIGLFLGGSNSMTGTLPMLIHSLNNYPDEFKKVINNNKLINNFIQETMRHTFVQSHLIRTANEDIVIENQLIKKGDKIAFLMGSANFDEEKFGIDAEDFKINRNYSKVNLAFGHGMYRCIGYSTAELQLKSLLLFYIKNINNISYYKTDFKSERNFTGTLIDRLYVSYSS